MRETPEKENRIFSEKNPSEYFKKILEETLREGAKQLLQQALENEDALKFRTQHLTISLPIFGTTQPMHVIENVKSTEVKLTQFDIDRINDIVLGGIVRGDRHPEDSKEAL